MYAAREAGRYVAGPLRKVPAPRALKALKSYVAVAPSPARSYPVFASEVNRRLQQPPFNFTNPLATFGGEKMVRK